MLAYQHVHLFSSRIVTCHTMAAPLLTTLKVHLEGKVTDGVLLYVTP